MPDAPATPLRASSAISSRASAADAAAEAAASLSITDADALVFFASAHHAASLERIAELLVARTNARTILACTAGAVLASGTELEDSPGLAALALRAPGVRFTPLTADDILGQDEPPATDEGRAETAARARAALFGLHPPAPGDAPPTFRGAIVLADPASTPVARVLAALNAAGLDPASPIVGGLASAARGPLHNRLMLNDRVHDSGLVGLALHGSIRMDALVSQGCRPLGEPMVITKASRSIIHTLGGHRAIDAVRHALSNLTEEQRSQLAGGLFLGRVVDEYKPRFGRGDFLIRNIIGGDEASGSIAVADHLRVGQTVQVHIRDAATAREDLQLLLDAQRLHTPPAAALMFTCNGRGRRLFGTPDADSDSLARALAPEHPGPERAKGGTPLDPDDHTLPTAGFFCLGEIGPVGGATHLHGHTASIALLRPAD
jgi:small ligand-binding sensory domain FIST